MIPGLGSSPGEGNDNPLQYSYLENSMDGGPWWATVHGGHKELDTTERLFTFTKYSLFFLFLQVVFYYYNFPFTTAFASSHRFCIIMFSLSFVSKLFFFFFNFLFYFFSNLWLHRSLCFNISVFVLFTFSL